MGKPQTLSGCYKALKTIRSKIASLEDDEQDMLDWMDELRVQKVEDKAAGEVK